MTRPKRILIVAGEPSGDRHAAGLVRRLRALDPSCDVAALGGKELAAAGANVIVDLVESAVVGFSEVVTHLPQILYAYNSAVTAAKQADLVVLVDYPGFNLQLAKKLHRLERRPRLLYYIAPQVWAWHKSRAELMARIIDRIAVVFPFEKQLFPNAEFVGHPLLDLPAPAPDPELAGRRVIALLPGSRRQEIQRHLGLMLELARALRARGDRPVLSVAHPGLVDLFQGVDCETWVGDPRRLVASADKAVVKSGTSTLETALIGTPFVTVYRLSWISYAIGRFLVKAKRIAMPNILLESDAVPELIQSDATPARVIAALDDLDVAGQKRAFERLRTLLGDHGSAERAARLALGMIA